jgi:hypothetical protein
MEQCPTLHTGKDVFSAILRPACWLKELLHDRRRAWSRASASETYNIAIADPLHKRLYITLVFIRLRIVAFMHLTSPAFHSSSKNMYGAGTRELLGNSSVLHTDIPDTIGLKIVSVADISDTLQGACRSPACIGSKEDMIWGRRFRRFYRCLELDQVASILSLNAGRGLKMTWV